MLKCQISFKEHYLINSWHAEDDDIREVLNEVSDTFPCHRILGSYPETQP